jgi:alkylation response protein AidB-like acyl-CoA dehydrogenase
MTFKDVRVPATGIVGELDDGMKVVDKVMTRAILATAAEAVGAIEVLYKDTIEYTKQREQFDHPLSDFQVLKHRMTEMFMEHSLAKSLCLKATMLESQDSKETERTIHALKFLIGKAGRFVGQNSVQLHGGMGMTEELRVAHYFKRLMVIDSQFGNSDFHLTQFTS